MPDDWTAEAAGQGTMEQDGHANLLKGKHSLPGGAQYWQPEKEREKAHDNREENAPPIAPLKHPLLTKLNISQPKRNIHQSQSKANRGRLRVERQHLSTWHKKEPGD